MNLQNPAIFGSDIVAYAAMQKGNKVKKLCKMLNEQFTAIAKQFIITTKIIEFL